MKSLEQISKQATDLCIAIENLPAGEQQTQCSVMADQLARDIRERAEAAINGVPFTPS